MVDFLLVEEGVLGASASGRRSVRGGDGEDADLPGANPGTTGSVGLWPSVSGRGLGRRDADLPRARTPTFPGEAWEPLGASASGRRSVKGGLDGGTPTFQGEDADLPGGWPGEPLGASASAVGQVFWGVGRRGRRPSRARTPTFPGRVLGNHWEQSPLAVGQ